jgi:hypothetical protein
VDPVIRYADSTFLIAHWHNVQLSDQLGIFSLQQLRELKAATETMKARFPGGFTGLNFIREGTQPSDKATRDELTRFLKSLRNGPVTYSASVMEGTGVVASAIRTLSRAIMAISGFRIDIVAVSNDAVRRLLPHLRTSDGQTVSRAELEAAIKFVRAAFDVKHSAAHLVTP